MPPIVRLWLWSRLLSTTVYDEHCRATWWFPEWHMHMTHEHFHCRPCRFRYIWAFDKALRPLFG